MSPSPFLSVVQLFPGTTRLSKFPPSVVIIFQKGVGIEAVKPVLFQDHLQQILCKCCIFAMTLQMTAPNDQEVLNARLFQPGSQKPARPQLDGTFLKLSFSYIPLKVISPTSNHRTMGDQTLPLWHLPAHPPLPF